ncbi:MAG: glutamine--tRNA ligase, partial [Methylococcales bacterium]|nr:glutamine--tRNA ligase [Methylococcales bacterium]
PESEENYLNALNPDSLEILSNSRVEASLANANPGDRFQFERTGYFCVDTVDSCSEKLVFNRTVTLRDTWEK